jgi:hypothetical protein
MGWMLFVSAAIGNTGLYSTIERRRIRIYKKWRKIYGAMDNGEEST